MAKWSLTGCWNDGKLVAEIEVEGRSGTSTVLFGEYRDGEHYICVPDLDVGCPLSFNVQDISWNSERLGRHMNRIDAATIAHAIADFARKTGWGCPGRPGPRAGLMEKIARHHDGGWHERKEKGPR